MFCAHKQFVSYATVANPLGIPPAVGIAFPCATATESDACPVLGGTVVSKNR